MVAAVTIVSMAAAKKAQQNVFALYHSYNRTIILGVTKILYTVKFNIGYYMKWFSYVFILQIKILNKHDHEDQVSNLCICSSHHLSIQISMHGNPHWNMPPDSRSFP